MEICFLNKNLDIRGGMGRFGRDIVENISKQKNVEAVVLTGETSNHKLEKPILRKSYLLRNFINIFINAFKIRKYVKKCDIIHALDGYSYGVIWTFNCGTEDVIIDGVTGLFIPQNDIKKTAEAILKLLNNLSLAKKLGENGRKRARQMNWDNVAKKYIKVYEGFISIR